MSIRQWQWGVSYRDGKAVPQEAVFRLDFGSYAK